MSRTPVPVPVKTQQPAVSVARKCNSAANDPNKTVPKKQFVPLQGQAAKSADELELDAFIEAEAAAFKAAVLEWRATKSNGQGGSIDFSSSVSSNSRSSDSDTQTKVETRSESLDRVACLSCFRVFIPDCVVASADCETSDGCPTLLINRRDRHCSDVCWTRSSLRAETSNGAVSSVPSIVNVDSLSLIELPPPSHALASAGSNADSTIIVAAAVLDSDIDKVEALKLASEHHGPLSRIGIDIEGLQGLVSLAVDVMLSRTQLAGNS